MTTIGMYTIPTSYIQHTTYYIDYILHVRYYHLGIPPPILKDSACLRMALSSDPRGLMRARVRGMVQTLLGESECPGRGLLSWDRSLLRHLQCPGMLRSWERQGVSGADAPRTPPLSEDTLALLRPFRVSWDRPLLGYPLGREIARSSDTPTVLRSASPGTLPRS